MMICAVILAILKIEKKPKNLGSDEALHDQEGLRAFFFEHNSLTKVYN